MQSGDVLCFYIASLTPHMLLRTCTFCEAVTLRKRHLELIVAKEDHPFVNGYNRSTLSYEKELPNRRVVAKDSVFVYVPVKFEAELFLY